MTGRINILFLCTGNICRSPMAEFIMKKLVSDSGAGPEFVISSAACTSEETGNDIYPPAKRKLKEKGIPFTFHTARRVTKKDLDSADYVVVMDGRNTRRLFSDFSGIRTRKRRTGSSNSPARTRTCRIPGIQVISRRPIPR